MRTRLGAWIALAAIGSHALWPLLAQAGTSAVSVQAEVCSASGPKHAAEAAPAQGPRSHAGGAHCLLCPLGAERGAAIPDSGPAGFALHDFTAPAPASSAAAPREIAVAADARPRAPPSRS